MRMAWEKAPAEAGIPFFAFPGAIVNPAGDLGQQGNRGRCEGLGEALGPHDMIVLENCMTLPNTSSSSPGAAGAGAARGGGGGG